MAETLSEIQETLDILRAAYKRAAESGGVSQYSLNSGQGNTNVKQATLAELRAEIEKFESKYNELLEIESGGNMTYIRGAGW